MSSSAAIFSSIALAFLAFVTSTDAATSFPEVQSGVDIPSPATAALQVALPSSQLDSVCKNVTAR